ncbi:MAG: outer membrane beta-barrel protein [Smithella sp.]
MRKIFFVGVALAALMTILSSESIVAADNTGFYIGVSGGYVIPQTMTISDPNNGTAYSNSILENGFLVGITAGWITPFTQRIMTLEMEYNYIFRTDFDNDKAVYLSGKGYGTQDGSIRINALLLNLKARYPKGRFHPYAGFGLGYAYSQVGDLTEREYNGSVMDIVPGESGGAFCWQILTGLDFDITTNFSAGIGYKYFATKPTIGSASTSGIYADIDYRTSIITLGLTFAF